MTLIHESASRLAAHVLVSHGEAARIRGISTKTLDRWVKAGLLPEPERIRGRKYHRVDAVVAVGSTQMSE
jgi:predicted site-specific integrase-resolvase